METKINIMVCLPTSLKCLMFAPKHYIILKKTCDKNYKVSYCKNQRDSYYFKLLKEMLVFFLQK